MSLSNPTPPKTYRLGVIAAKTMDNPSLMEELLGENLVAVAHLHTNGANDLVTSFSRENGIPYTVWPLHAGRSLPWSTSRVIENSDFVFIISTPDSKSAASAVKECEVKGVKHRLVQYDPFTHWRTKVGQVAEILAAQTPEQVEEIPSLKAIKGVLS